MKPDFKKRLNLLSYCEDSLIYFHYIWNAIDFHSTVIYEIF